MVTPGSIRRQKRSRSSTSTPSQQQPSEGPGVRQQLFFPPLSEIQNLPSSPHPTMLSESPSLVGEKDGKDEGEAGDRTGVEEVLAEELRVLQENRNTLNRQLEVPSRIFLITCMQLWEIAYIPPMNMYMYLIHVHVHVLHVTSTMALRGVWDLYHECG